MEKFDYLIVGSGLFGCVFAYEATRRGKKVLVVDKRDHAGGNIYCDVKDDILIHKYGAHIFHTKNPDIWAYVHQFADFNHYINSPIANYRGEIYNLPFNMNTFSRMWGVSTPNQAYEIIQRQRAEIKNTPRNLEEQAISLVGVDIYKKLIQGYTEKQWGRKCTELPPFIIKRLPVRYTYDNNYFNDPFQGIPMGGYNVIVDKLLQGSQILLNTDFFEQRLELQALAPKTIFTGPLDAYFDYKFGPLEYRSLQFETEKIETENYQGVAVVNYTDIETPFTRMIEHKHFAFGTQPVTYITKEYPSEQSPGQEPYYPVNDDKNTETFSRYWSLVQEEKNVIFGGRLAEYKYYDMDQVIASALEAVSREFSTNN